MFSFFWDCFGVGVGVGLNLHLGGYGQSCLNCFISHRFLCFLYDGVHSFSTWFRGFYGFDSLFIFQSNLSIKLIADYLMFLGYHQHLTSLALISISSLAPFASAVLFISSLQPSSPTVRPVQP